MRVDCHRCLPKFRCVLLITPPGRLGFQDLKKYGLQIIIRVFEDLAVEKGDAFPRNACTKDDFSCAALHIRCLRFHALGSFIIFTADTDTSLQRFACFAFEYQTWNVDVLLSSILRYMSVFCVASRFIGHSWSSVWASCKPTNKDEQFDRRLKAVTASFRGILSRVTLLFSHI